MNNNSKSQKHTNISHSIIHFKKSISFGAKLSSLQINQIQCLTDDLTDKKCPKKKLWSLCVYLFLMQKI